MVPPAKKFPGVPLLGIESPLGQHSTLQFPYVPSCTPSRVPSPLIPLESTSCTHFHLCFQSFHHNCFHHFSHRHFWWRPPFHLLNSFLIVPPPPPSFFRSRSGGVNRRVAQPDCPTADSPHNLLLLQPYGVRRVLSGRNPLPHMCHNCSLRYPLLSEDSDADLPHTVPSRPPPPHMSPTPLYSSGSRFLNSTGFLLPPPPTRIAPPRIFRPPPCLTPHPSPRALWGGGSDVGWRGGRPESAPTIVRSLRRLHPSHCCCSTPPSLFYCSLC